MHDWVRVIALEPGELTFALAPGYPGDPTAELRDALLRATGTAGKSPAPEGDAEPSLREAAEAPNRQRARAADAPAGRSHLGRVP